MTVTSRPQRAPARSVGAPPGHHDPALYQRFQRCGADLAGLLTQAERRARAAGHLPQATAYLRRWVAVQDQRRRTPPGDHTGQRQAIRRWSAEAAALRDLEAILHPAMRDRFLRTIHRLIREGGRPCIVLDAAVLLEAGWDDLCDRIAFVDAPRPERLRRVKPSRGWSEATFEARERSQWPVEEKRQRVDWIITNEGSPDRLGLEIERLWAWLQGGAAPEATSAGSSTRLACSTAAH